MRSSEKKKTSRQTKTIGSLKKQRQYLKRNLDHIEQLLAEGASLQSLKKRDYKLLLVVTEVSRQQLWMYQNNKQSIEDRIVSLTQPHIRPIVRGKAGNPGEFGAKFSASCVDGYVFLDRISWDNFNLEFRLTQPATKLHSLV